MFRITRIIVVFLFLTTITKAQTNGLHFDGVNDYVNASTNFNSNTSFSWEAWIKTTSNGPIIAKSPSNTFDIGSKALHISSGRLTFSVNINGIYSVQSATTINDGNWHHVAVTSQNEFSGNNDLVTLYVDGNVSATKSDWNINTYTETGNTKFGFANTNYPSPAYFSGTIDEIRIWSTTRTQAQLQANTVYELYGAQPNLSGYFRLDEGTANGTNTSISFVSSSSGNATLSGFSLTGTTSNFVVGRVYLEPNPILSSLSVTGFTLNPVFSSSTTVYQTVLSSSIGATTITPSVLDTGCRLKYKINGGTYTSILNGQTSSSITVAASGITQIDILVETTVGYSSNLYSLIIFSPIVPGLPNLTSYTPSRSYKGSLITLNGSNLANLSEINVGSGKASILHKTSNRVVGVVMPDATNGTVTATNSQGSFTDTNSITVSARASNKYPIYQMGNKILGTSNSVSNGLGISIDISADGNTMISGANSDNSYTGSALIFTRGLTSWSVQGTKLQPTGVSGTLGFGYSVAISGDGNTAVIGAPMANGSIGGFFVFTRSGTTWTQQGQMVLPEDKYISSVGDKVDITSDGEFIAVNANKAGTNGVVYIFKRSGSSWLQQGGGLVQNPTPPNSTFGRFLSFSGDGNYLAVGINTGAVIFKRNVSVYEQEGSAISISGVLSNYFGSISLNADGSMMAIGVPNETPNGATYMLKRNGVNWTQFGTKITPSNVTGSAVKFGSAVALNGAGDILAVGAPSDNSNLGAHYVFKMNAASDGFEAFGSKLVASNPGGLPQIGYSICLSADGNYMGVGSLGDMLGAVWFYNSPSDIADLASLTASSGVLTRAFDPNVLNYTLVGGNNFTFTATTIHNNTSLSFNPKNTIYTAVPTTYTTPNFNAENGCQNVYQFLVRSPDNTNTKIYTIEHLPQISPSSGTFSITNTSGPIGHLIAVPGYGFNNGCIDYQVGGAPAVYIQDYTINANPMVLVLPNSGNGPITITGPSVNLTSTTNYNQVQNLYPPNVSIGNKYVDFGGNQFGAAIALSANGNNSIVGAPTSNSNNGRAFIQTRTGNAAWTHQFVLNPTFPSNQPQAGTSVAINATGNHAIIGGPNHAGGSGAVWFYYRGNSQTSWTSSVQGLTPNNLFGLSNFGSAVSMSANAYVAAIGAKGYSSNRGGIWIYRRSETTWSQGQTILATDDVVNGDYLGSSIAMSADANYIVAGAPGDNSNVGAVFVFVRVGRNYEQQGLKLVGTDASGASLQGSSVAINGDGSLIVVGAPADNGNIGAVWIFKRTGTTWSQVGSKIIPTNHQGQPQFGSSVSLNLNGAFLSVGGPTDNANQGAAWVYRFASGNWVRYGNKLVASGNSGAANFGSAVALTGDGTSLVVGAKADNSSMGAIWTYRLPSSNANILSITGIPTASSFNSNTLNYAGGTISSSTTSVNVTFTANSFAEINVNGSGYIPMVYGSPTNAYLSNIPVSGTGNNYLIKITAEDGFTQQLYSFTFSRTQSAPTISSVAPAYPNHIAAGSLLAVSGTNLDNVVSVEVGTVRAKIINSTSSNVWVYVPNGATNLNVRLTTAGGVATYTTTAYTLDNRSKPSTVFRNKITTSGTNRIGTNVWFDDNLTQILTGAPGYNNNAGALYSLTRSFISTTSTWSTNLHQYTAGSTFVHGFGTSFSATPFNNLFVVGGPTDSSNIGGIWIKNTNPGQVVGVKVPVINTNGTSRVGSAVAINKTTNFIATGGPEDSSGFGAVWVFRRFVDNTFYQGKVKPTDAVGNPKFGSKVVFNFEGTLLFVSGINDDDGKGAVWVYYNNGGVWTQLGPKLVPSGIAINSNFGSDIAISNEDSILLVGASGANSGQGAAYIYKCIGGVWMLQGGAITSSEIVGAGKFGSSVDLNHDGTTLVIGAPEDNNGVGACFNFIKVGNSYQQFRGKLTPTSAIGQAKFGSSVSITPNSLVLAVGAPNDNNGQGAVYHFDAKSTNSQISSISTNRGSISPTFNKDVTSYSMNVGFNISDVTIYVGAFSTTTFLKARINGGSYITPSIGSLTSTFTLNLGANVIEIEALSEDSSSTKTYTLIVTKPTTVGNALHFDGLNDGVVISDAGAVHASSNFTIECWIKTPRTSSDQTIVSRVNNGYVVLATIFGTNRGSQVGRVEFGGENGGFNQNWTLSNSTIDDNNWHHVALVVSSGARYIYFDGVLNVSQSVGGNHQAAGSQPLTLGYTTMQGRRFAGIMDDFKFWNVARTQAQIQAGMNAELTVPQTGLLLYYPFNQGVNGGDNTAISTVSDLSGNNRHGTLVDFAKNGSTSNFIQGNVPGANSSITTLNNLVVSSGTLTPSFSPTIYSYFVQLPVNTTGVTITPTYNVVGGVIRVNVNNGSFEFVKSDSSTSLLQLNNGTNSAQVITTAPNGTSQTYTIQLVSPDPPIVGNTISANQDLCPGIHMDTLRGTTPTGGNNTYNYQWIFSASSANVGYTAITGANSPNLEPQSFVGTRWFKRVVRSGTNSDTSAAIQVIINTSIVNNTISGNQNACLGTVISNIIGQTPSGGNGLSYIYQWLASSTSSTSGFAIASGNSNQLNYTSPNVTQNTWYKRVVSSGSCVVDTSNAILITYIPLKSIGLSSVLNCNNTATYTLSLNGHIADSIKWLDESSTLLNSSTSSAPYTSIKSGAHTALIKFNDGCYQSVSDTQNLPGLLTNNSISGNQNACIGATLTNLSGSTPTGSFGGYVYQWISSTTSANQGYTPAVGVNNSKDYVPAALTQTTWFKRIVTSGSCPNDTSASVRIQISLPISGNVVGGEQSICPGNVPVGLSGVMPTGGLDNAYSYLWIISTVDSINGFSNATGVNNQVNYSPSAQNVTTWYKRVVNSGFCSADTSLVIKVTAIDTIKPIALGQNKTLYLGSNGTVTTSSTAINSGSSDNCSISSLVINKASFNCTNIGTNNVVLTVTDPSGNFDTTEVTITVLDTLKPNVIVQNRTVYLDPFGLASVTLAQLNNGSTDNCAIDTMYISNGLFTCANTGLNNVTLTVIDVNGNSQSATAIVTVVDTIRPNALITNKTLYLDENGVANLTAAQVDNASTDNCGIASIALSKTSFTCTDIGTNNVIFTVTDFAGNSKTANVVVTVIDTIKPTAIAQNKTVYLGNDGTSTLLASSVNNGSTDNCNVSNLSLSKSVYTCSDIGVSTQVLTVTDLSNNTDTASFSVTVLDTMKPVIDRDSLYLYLNTGGSASLTSSILAQLVNDNCGIDTFWTTSNLNYTCSNLGTNLVTINSIDNSGNSFAKTINVVVIDTISPIVTCNNISAFLNSSGSVTVTTAQVSNSAVANCGNASLAFQTLSSDLVTNNSFIGNTLPPNFTSIGPRVWQSNQTGAQAFIGQQVLALVNADQDAHRSYIKTIATDFLSKDFEFEVTYQIQTSSNSGMVFFGVGNANPGINGEPSQGVFLRLHPNGFTGFDGIALINNSGSFAQYPFNQSTNGNNVGKLKMVKSGNSLQFYVASGINGIYNAYGSAINLSQSNLSFLNTSNSSLFVGSGHSQTQFLQFTTKVFGPPPVNLGGSINYACNSIGSNQIKLIATANNGKVSSCISTINVLDTTKPVVATQNATVYLNANGSSTISSSSINNGSSDACGIGTVTVTPNTFTCANIGSNQVTLTVQDVNGNSNTANATVTVVDTVRPTVLTQNRTIYLNVNGQATISAAQINNGSNDACGIASLTLSKTTFTCANIGSNQVTLTVEDVNGNSNTANAIVNVVDTVRPVVITQNRTIYLNASGQATITAAQINNGSRDTCGLASLSLSQTTFTCANIGANIVTLTVQDNNGNSNTGLAVITVLDTIKPVVITQNRTIYLNASGQAVVPASLVNNGSTDACGIGNLSLSQTTFTCANIGTNLVTLNVQDVNNNVSSGTAIITVLDTIRPTVITQNRTVYLNANGLATITTAMVNNGSTDACGIDSVYLSNTIFTCANLGANQVGLTVKDINGNVNTGLATINILDTVRPVVLTQNRTVYLNSSGQATISASQINNGSNDACGIASLNLSKTTFTCSDVGLPVPVVLTVQDVNGNTKTGTATVTVIDTISPIVITQNRTVYLNSFGQGTVTAAQVNNGSSDICGIANLSLSKTVFSCSDIGTPVPVILTVQDVNGNIKTGTAFITVLDTIKPIVITQNRTVYLNPTGQATISTLMVDNGSNDSCGIQSLSLSNTSFTCANIGANTVILTVQDVNGNSNSGSAIITVLDTVKPVVATQNRTIYLNAFGQATLNASSINNGSSDACGIASLNLSQTVFTCANIGANPVLLTVQDVNGNTNTGVATVFVLDTIKPNVITQNHTAYLNANGQVTVSASQINNNSNDSCGIAAIVLSKTEFDCSNLGANTVTLTVTDVNSNSSSATATITVIDTIKPIVICKADTVILNANGTGTTTAARLTQFATDNCSIASAVISKSNFVVADIGHNNVTLTITDSSGNFNTCIADVFVIEPQPVAICQNKTIYLNSSGSASLTVNDVDNGSYSLVGLSNRAINKSTFTCADLGVNSVKLVVTNMFNKSDSCTAIVTVLDTIKPNVVKQNVTTYLGVNGIATINASSVNNGSNDNCSISSLSLSKTSFDCSNLGVNNVWFIVTDNSGNKDSVLVTVNVIDTIKPIIRSKSNVVLYLTANGSLPISSSVIDNGSTDNCSVDTIYLSQFTVTCADLGVKKLALTVIDQSNNSTTDSISVVVLDPIAPIARPKAKVVVYLSTNGQAVINPSIIDSASSDNCTITSRLISQTVFTCNHIGLNTVTFTVQDQSGNSSFATALVEVRDTIKPNVIVSNQTLYLNSLGNATTNALSVNNNSTDNCGIDSVWLSKTNFTCADVGTSIVSLFVRDVNGNTNSAPVAVTVFDTIRPLVRAKQGIVAYLNSNGSASITVNQVDSFSSDNCSLASLSLNKTIFTCADLGSNTLFLQGIDVNGNSNSYSFNVFVRDTIKPSLSTANATVYLNAAGSASVNAQSLLSASTDNCGTPVITINNGNFTCANRGANVVTVTSTDGSGNSISANATVTVVDTIRPIVVAQNITAYLNANGSAVITTTQANNGSSDNCGIASYGLSKTNFTGADLGINYVTLTATDASGNVNSSAFTVTILDTVRPVAVAQNVSVYLNANGTASVTATQVNNGSSDNVSVTALSLSKTTFTCSDLGSNSIVLTVTDASNNSNTVSTTVMVYDTIKPVAVGQNITTYLNGIGLATITPSQVNNNSSDNCSVSAITLSKTTFTCANTGANVVSLTATDASGNTSMTNVTVTVLDTIKPNVVVNNNLNLYLNASGTVNLTTVQVNNGSSDNCSIASLALSKSNFNSTEVGIHTVVFSVTDASGNLSSVNVNVIVLDTVRPIVSTINKTIYLNQAGQATVTASEINNGSTDNVGVVGLALSKYAYNCSELGVNIILFQAIDGSGNIGSGNVRITVLDTIKPQLLFQPSNLVFGKCGSKVNFTIPPVIDNCGQYTITQTAGIPNGGIYPVGTTMNTFVITDLSGNSITTSFSVTILPSYLPVTFKNLEMCSNATSVDLSQGKDSLTFTGSGVLSDGITFDPRVSGAGNHLVNYLFTDSMGCANEGSFFVTVFPSPETPDVDRVNSTTLKVREVFASYQWYYNNQPSPGQTRQAINVERSGIYYVMVKNNNGCAAVSEPIGIGVKVGLNVVEDKANFNVYPNPNSGRFTIEYNKPVTLKEHAKVIITDLLGKEIYQTEVSTAIIDINLSEIAPGTYYVRMIQGDAVTVKPIVIKN